MKNANPILIKFLGMILFIIHYYFFLLERVMQSGVRPALKQLAYAKILRPDGQIVLNQVLAVKYQGPGVVSSNARSF